MVATLSTELTAYVHELCAVVEGLSRPQSDSTAASGDSHKSAEEGIAELEASLEGMCE
jgi:hypothetical protein